MKEITEREYEFALERVEELLPLVTDDTPADDKKSVELALMSDIVIDYEKKHFPIAKPTVAELIGGSLKEKGMTQRELAQQIGVSPSRVSDYVKGKAIPSLSIAGTICKTLGIKPALILGMA